MGQSRTVSEINDAFNRKSPIFLFFFYPRVFYAAANGTPLGIGWRRKGQKQDWWATGPNKKFDDVFSRVDTIHQRNRQTEWQTPDNSKDRA